MANEFNIKNGFITSGNSNVYANLNVSGGITANTISATTIVSTSYSGNSNTITGTYGNVYINNGNTGLLIFSGTGTVGGSGYTDFIKVINTFSAATNPNKTIRVNSSGSLEVINSAYSATTFSIADNGIVTITTGAAVSSNSATTNSLNVGNKGQLFDDGNFHVHTNSGSLWINSLDGGAIRLGTQTNSGNSPVIVDTTTVGHSFFTKAQSSFNAAAGTEVSMDNLKVRVNNTAGSSLNVQAGAVSGTFNAYTTLITNAAGHALRGDTNSAGITFTTTYANISAAQQTLDSGGDVTEVHLTDTTNSRIYRITAIHGQSSNGAYISIERMS